MAPHAAWTRAADDTSPQAYVRMSRDVSTTLTSLKQQEPAKDEPALRQQLQLIQSYLPVISDLTTWNLDALTDTKAAVETAQRLRTERDSA